MSHVLFAYPIKLNISTKNTIIKNSTKEVILWFQVIFAMQSWKYWTNFHVISSLILHEIWLIQYFSWASQILCNILIPHLQGVTFGLILKDGGGGGAVTFCPQNSVVSTYTAWLKVFITSCQHYFTHRLSGKRSWFLLSIIGKEMSNLHPPPWIRLCVWFEVISTRTKFWACIFSSYIFWTKFQNRPFS